MNSKQLIVGFYYIRAAMAQKKGLFDQEITPVTTKFVDENGTERTITVTKDDGIRPGTTFEVWKNWAFLWRKWILMEEPLLSVIHWAALVLDMSWLCSMSSNADARGEHT